MLLLCSWPRGTPSARRQKPCHFVAAAAQLRAYEAMGVSASACLVPLRNLGPLSGAPMPAARSASAAACGLRLLAASFASSPTRRLCGLVRWCDCSALASMKYLLQATQ